MKRILLIALILSLAGCVTVNTHPPLKKDAPDIISSGSFE